MIIFPLDICTLGGTAGSCWHPSNKTRQYVASRKVWPLKDKTRQKSVAWLRGWFLILRRLPQSGWFSAGPRTLFSKLWPWAQQGASLKNQEMGSGAGWAPHASARAPFSSLQACLSMENSCLSSWGDLPTNTLPIRLIILICSKAIFTIYKDFRVTTNQHCVN